MPLPVLNLTPELDLTQAIDQALVKAGALTQSGRFSDALESYGISLDSLAQQFANLISSAKDPVKLKAILAALNAHGIDLEPKIESQVPSIHVNIVSKDSDIALMFSPRR